MATTTWRLRGLHGKGDLTGAVTLVTGGKKVSVRPPGKEGATNEVPGPPTPPYPLSSSGAPMGSQNQESRAASWGGRQGEGRVALEGQAGRARGLVLEFEKHDIRLP